MSQKWSLTIGAVLIALIISASFYGLQVFNQEPLYVAGSENVKPSTLTVRGTGEVNINPDRVKIAIGAITEGTTANEAVQANAEIFESVFKVLDDQEITKENIVTTTYDIYPIYNYRESQPVLIGYRVNHQITVTIISEDLDILGSKVGEIIDSTVNVGINQINSVQFAISDDQIKVLRNEALRNAVLDADEKGILMAETLEIDLIGVYEITENIGYFESPTYSGYDERSSTQLVPGVLKITASVQITYIIG